MGYEFEIFNYVLRDGYWQYVLEWYGDSKEEALQKLDQLVAQGARCVKLVWRPARESKS